MLKGCCDLLLHKVFEAALISVDDERCVGEISVPLLDRMDNSHQFFLVD